MSKPQTRASYDTRLNRVVDYIYAHLDEDIRFDDLAEVACLSPYHWHRIYAVIRGETIAATVRRLRLLRAADRLANSSESIEIIAERAGYGALDAFARTFKETGVLPAAPLSMCLSLALTYHLGARNSARELSRAHNRRGPARR